MPRGRPKGSKNKRPEAETEQVKSSDVKSVISAGKLKKLMAAKRSTTNDMHELAGTLGQMIKDAIENNHLHRKAFGVICVLDKMENEKLRDFLDHFEYYLDVSGIGKRADSVMRMNLGEKNDEAENDDDDTNVVQMPKDAA